MPKNTVTDPITDQEINFAHFLLSGTMTDREAAEAAGLNPDTASYTKAKPRVRTYMEENRAAVAEKLVEQEAEGLRKRNLSREKILDRLWELASLSPEATRGNIAGQMKAMTMIVAIEGLIPDRRAPRPQTQATPQSTASALYRASCRVQTQQNQEPANPQQTVAAASPTPNPTPDPKPETSDAPAPGLVVGNPSIQPEKQSRAPEAIGSWRDAARATEALRNAFSINREAFSGYRR